MYVFKELIYLVISIVFVIGGVMCYVEYNKSGQALYAIGKTAEKIYHFFSEKEAYHLSTDTKLTMTICNALKGVLGDKRYRDLEQLNTVCPIIYFNRLSNLPVIQITVNTTDEDEKLRLEHLLLQITKANLAFHGYKGIAIAEWYINNLLHLPMLVISYAEGANEEEILRRTKAEAIKKTLNKYKSCVYEDDDE